MKKPARRSALPCSEAPTFSFAPDSPAVHATWQKLVAEHGVSGKQVHDTAIVAAAKAASADQVLTFNREHFQRFESEITIRTPQEIIQEQQRQRQAEEQAHQRNKQIDREIEP